MSFENFKKKDTPLVWAHRGASGYAPENTIESFGMAIEQGADGIELDVQLTKDDVLVVIHDEWIDRTSDGKGWVKDYTFEELRFLYNGIIIKHQKTEPTYTKTSLFLCEKRRFFMARREKGVVPIIYFEKERGKSF